MPVPTLSFTAWLQQQVTRNDPVGDLARDASTDATWPTTTTYEPFEIHVSLGAHNDPTVLAALRQAWHEWRSLRLRPVKPHSTKRR